MRSFKNNSVYEWRFSLINPGQESIDITTKLLPLSSDSGVVDSQNLRQILLKYGLTQVTNTNTGLLIENLADKEWRPLSVAVGSQFRFILNAGSTPPLRIVYYVNGHVNPRFWRMMRAQLAQLKKTALLKRQQTSLFVVFAGTSEQRKKVKPRIRRFLKNVSDFSLELVPENVFEYPGIEKAWRLAQENQEGLILYFHAKGLSHLELDFLGMNRMGKEKVLFEKVVSEWKANIQWLQHMPDIDKLGIQCGGRGWVWYNFWWARSQHVYNLERPRILSARHYYEDWLCRDVKGIQTTPGVQAHDFYPQSISRCLSIDSVPEKALFNLGASFIPQTAENQAVFLKRRSTFISIGNVLRSKFTKGSM